VNWLKKLRYQGQRKKEVDEALAPAGKAWIARWHQAGSSMCISVLPSLSHPTSADGVQLTGGRFATSDLNDLYRRVINPAITDSRG